LKSGLSHEIIGVMFRDPVLIDRARALRRDMGSAEKKLWYQLRRRQMAGHRFRRQVPIGSYIADFACLSARLIIEIDGGQHNEEANENLDAKRTAWLESRGYRVLRFWNSYVLDETDSVTETIFNALTSDQGSGSDHPPP
jgi:very-short-patch-repair endonuclease